MAILLYCYMAIWLYCYIAIWLPVVLVLLESRNLGIWEGAPPLGGREAVRGMPKFRALANLTSTTGMAIWLYCYIVTLLVWGKRRELLSYKIFPCLPFLVPGFLCSQASMTRCGSICKSLTCEFLACLSTKGRGLVLIPHRDAVSRERNGCLAPGMKWVLPVASSLRQVKQF